jgi:Fe-S cluster biogenesis protein NfuA/nitrite reductase/ring-hydroxylating ferredoxin subunit
LSVQPAPEPDALVARVEELTAQLEAIGDPFARSCAEELAGALMGLYGEGLERIFETLEAEGPALAEVRERLAEDGVVASLMLIHGLYPVDLETRVVEALDSVRPYMESHGGNVELLGIVDGVARLRLEGSCNGCPASASTMELAIEQALQDAAPDLAGIDVEGVTAPPPPALGGFELPMSDGGPPVERSGDERSARGSGWTLIEGLGSLMPGAVIGASAGGRSLVVANVAGDLLAYRNRCAGCGAALDHGDLSGGTLHCPSCARGFDLPLAGRCVSEAGLQLEPVPLLREGDGGVRVALAA